MEDYKNLTYEELIELSFDIGLHDEALNKEWYRRFKMNFPYSISPYSDRIINCITKEVIKDEECDKLVLDQANELRSSPSYREYRKERYRL